MAGTMRAIPVLLMSRVWPSREGSFREPFELALVLSSPTVKVSCALARLARRRFPKKRRNCDAILRGSSDISLGPQSVSNLLRRDSGSKPGSSQFHSKEPEEGVQQLISPANPGCCKPGLDFLHNRGQAGNAPRTNILPLALTKR